MDIDWDGIDFSEYELMILQKICHKRRFCKAHLQKESLLSGVKKDKIGFMKEALDNLIRLGITAKYKTQGRYDNCFPKENYVPSLKVLKRYADEYDFIDKSLFNDLSFTKSK